MKTRFIKRYAIQIGDAFVSYSDDRPYLWTSKKAAQSVRTFLENDLPPDSPLPVVTVYRLAIRG